MKTRTRTRLIAVAASVSVALSVSAGAAQAAVEKQGTRYCSATRGESGPYATGLAYGELKLKGPGQSYYLVWWIPTWEQKTANGVGAGGYWRAVVNTGALNDWGTYASCYYQ